MTSSCPPVSHGGAYSCFFHSCLSPNVVYYWRIKKKSWLNFCSCLYLCVFVHALASVCHGATCGQSLVGVDSEPRSSSLAASTLTYWSISLASFLWGSTSKKWDLLVYVLKQVIWPASLWGCRYYPVFGSRDFSVCISSVVCLLSGFSSCRCCDELWCSWSIGLHLSIV